MNALTLFFFFRHRDPLGLQGTLQVRKPIFRANLKGPEQSSFPVESRPVRSTR